MHQKSILCHALFFQQAVVQNIDAPKNPIINSTFLKATNAVTIQNLVFLVIRDADICVCCLVSTLDASLSQVSVKKKTCRLCWNTHRTVMLHWHRLSSTVPLAAPCCITAVLRQSLFSRARHAHAKGTREMTPLQAPPAPSPTYARHCFNHPGATRTVRQSSVEHNKQIAGRTDTGFSSNIICSC